MGDEGFFDPCECIQGHESSMRRLLGLLRQSQSYCTESSCNEERPATQLSDGLPGSVTVLVAISAAWAAMMAGMYMFGVSPRRNRDGEKPGPSNGHWDPEPPAIS